MIARQDLPLCFGASSSFEEYIKVAHNPRFSHVSAQTTARDMTKYFAANRVKLIENLIGVSSVALTSDIWSGNTKEDYLSVVAHYVNPDWHLEKRIIGFRLIDESHSGENIAERVSAVLDEYGLMAKVFSVTLDNASSNNKAIRTLAPELCSYVGAIESLAPKLSGYVGTLFLHQRCACHIINLMVKSGLDLIKHYLEDIRSAVYFLNSSNQPIANFKRFCIAVDDRPRKFGLDMDVRWNSTFLMLKHLIPYKHNFTVFVNSNYPRGEDEARLLTDEHWFVAEKMFEFLELFYDATVALSGVYYPTSPLMLHHMILICKHFKLYENDSLLRPVVNKMKDVYIKYWRDIPMLYSFAFVLDPRAKLKRLNSGLRLLGKLIGVDYYTYITEVRAQLNTMYKRYDDKFGAVKMRAPTQPSSSGKKKSAWDDIFADDEEDEASGNSFCTPPVSLLLQAASTSAGASLGIGNELANYLDSDVVSQFDDEFSIIGWWHEHKLTYPVLAILARDVLTVPVSTVSSESAFSTTGRILEERRRRLSSEMVEILTCTRDWESADARLQQQVEDKSLEKECFADQFLDVTPKT